MYNVDFLRVLEGPTSSYYPTTPPHHLAPLCTCTVDYTHSLRRNSIIHITAMLCPNLDSMHSHRYSYSMIFCRHNFSDRGQLGLLLMAHQPEISSSRRLCDLYVFLQCDSE